MHSYVFLPFITLQLRNASRVYIVWNVYHQDSLKTEARTKRGKGVQRRVEPASNIPGKCQEFLLANAVSIQTDKEIFTTLDNKVICNKPRDLSGLSPCSHKEAYILMMLHVQDAFSKFSVCNSLYTSAHNC